MNNIRAELVDAWVSHIIGIFFAERAEHSQTLVDIVASSIVGESVATFRQSVAMLHTMPDCGALPNIVTESMVGALCNDVRHFSPWCEERTIAKHSREIAEVSTTVFCGL